MKMIRRGLRGSLVGVALGVAFLTGPMQPAWAETAPEATKSAADPAALAVQDFYDVLFESMRHAGEWKMQGRYDHLFPVMIKLFDVPTMTRVAVGPDFAKLPPDQQETLRTAFAKLLVATFASTFDDFKGETYSVNADVAAQGQDKFVKSRFNGAGAPVDINYLLRRKNDAWRIIDIYLNGTISQLATWRSEYGAAFQQQGFDGLMAAVEAQTTKDMRAF